MKVLYQLNTTQNASQIAQRANNDKTRAEMATGVRMVTGMPRQSWFGEIVANVTERVKKWEEWEKSPALRRSEELLRQNEKNGSRNNRNGAISRAAMKAVERRTGT